MENSEVPSDSHGPPGLILLFVLAIGVTGSLAVWWSISERGIGLTHDSVSYWSTAERIVADFAFGSPWQQPLTSWPLGYPVLLASLASLLGVSVLAAGELIATVLPLALALLSWRLLSRVVTSPVLLVGGVAASTLAGPLLSTHNKLLTDGLFTVGVFALLLLLFRFLECEGAGRHWWLAGAVVVTWGLFLLRYVGILLPVAGAVVLAMPPAHRRFRSALGYAGASFVVPAIYVVWRSQVAPETIGSGPLYGVGEVPGIVINWLALRPAVAPPTAFGLVALGVLVLATVVMIVRYIRHEFSGLPTSSPRETTLVRIGTFWLLLFGAIVSLRLVVEFYIESRTLLVLLPLAILLVAGMLDRLPPSRTAHVAVGVFAVWAMLAAASGVEGMIQQRPLGSGFRDRSLEPLYADLAEALRSIPLDCQVVTNNGALLYVVGLVTQPMNEVSASDLTDGGAAFCLVWVLPPTGQDIVDALSSPWRPDLSQTPIFTGDGVTVYQLSAP